MRRQAHDTSCTIDVYVGRGPATTALEAVVLLEQAQRMMRPLVNITFRVRSCAPLALPTQSPEATLDAFERTTRAHGGDACARILFAPIPFARTAGIAYVGCACDPSCNAAAVYTLHTHTALYVLAHEILHLLGARHSDNATSVMYPYPGTQLPESIAVDWLSTCPLSFGPSDRGCAQTGFGWRFVVTTAAFVAPLAWLAARQ